MADLNILAEINVSHDLIVIVILFVNSDLVVNTACDKHFNIGFERNKLKNFRLVFE